MLPSEQNRTEKKKKFGELFDFQFHYLFRYSDGISKIHFTVGLLASLLGGLTLPLLLLFMARASISVLSAPAAVGTPEAPPSDAASVYNSLNDIIYMMLYLLVASFVIYYFSSFCMEYACARQCERLRQVFFKKTIDQDMSWFDSIDTGTLTTRMEEDLTLIREALGVKIGHLVTFLSIFICALSVALSQDARMTGLMVVVYFYMAPSMLFTSVSLVKGIRESQKSYENAGSVCEEATLLIRMVKAYEAVPKFLQIYKSYLKKSEWITIRNFFLASTGFGLMMAGMSINYSWGIFWAGNLLSSRFADDTFDSSKTLASFMIMNVSSMMLGQIAPHLLAVSKGVQAAKDLFEIIDRKPKIDSSDTSGEKGKRITGQFSFKNVSFRYESGTSNVFEGISFTANADETIAIVGPSGAGKSTIASLLQRFYDVDEGEITLDGRNIKEYNVQFLRSQMGVISQQPRLFSLSIEDNIKFGRSEASTLDEVKNAAKSAYASDFIKTFPDKYNTLVGEGGSHLSGGQKQRVAIARAMLRNPSIYILDEATSALDVESEKLVHQAFDELMAKGTHTTLIIAHRLSTIKNADKILVLGKVDGVTKIVQEGNHEKLMEDVDGEYYRMMNAQTGDASSDVTNKNETAVVKDKLNREESLISAKEMEKEFEVTTQSWLDKLKGLRKTATREEKIFKKQMYQLVWKQRVWWIGSFLCSILVGAVFPIMAYLFTGFMGQIAVPSSAEALLDVTREYSFYMLMNSLGTFVVTFLQWISISNCSARFVTDLRMFIFNRLLSFPISFFDAPENNVGAISTVLSSDVRYIDGGYSVNYPIIIQCLSTIVISFTYAFILDAKFAGIMLAAFAAMAPTVVVRGKRTKTKKADVSHKSDTTSSGFLMHESLIGISSVKSYGLQDVLYKRFESILSEEYSGEKRTAYFYGVAVALSQAGMFGINALAMSLARDGIERGDFTSQEIIRAIFMIIFAVRGLNQVAIFSADIKKANESETTVANLLEKDPTIQHQIDGNIMLEKVSGNVNVKNLKFQYPRRPIEVYNSVSFDVKAGEMVALVGESGCGKSTIVHLLEKLYDYRETDVAIAVSSKDPTAIQRSDTNDFDEIDMDITVDGISVADINTKSLRSYIGYVSQDPSLFNTTIKENIKMGKPDATDEEVVEAAKIANAHEFIDAMDEKYDAPVGRLGGRLSGGQKQRIAIARAVIRKPSLLLLDEATSALDAEGEKIVQEALDKLLADRSRTSIVIAHRLSTIKNADKIIVLERDPSSDKGSIVAEIGSHDELMCNNGTYKNMVLTAWS